MISREELMRNPNIAMVVTYDEGTTHGIIAFTQEYREGEQEELKAFMEHYRALSLYSTVQVFKEQKDS